MAEINDEILNFCNVYVNINDDYPLIEEKFFECSEENKTVIDMLLLQIMILSTSSYEEIEEILHRGLKRGVDYVNICNDGRTLNPVHDRDSPLIWVARSKEHRDDGGDITKMLLKWGANINAKNSSEFSAEEIALLMENWSVLQVLVDNK